LGVYIVKMALILDAMAWKTAPRAVTVACCKAEEALRVTLSTLGIGHFVLNNRSPAVFPLSAPLHLDFRAALMDGTIRRVLCVPETDAA
jgi:hypothetical protein